MGKYNRNSNYTPSKKFRKFSNPPKNQEAQDNFEKNNLSDQDRAKLHKQ